MATDSEQYFQTDHLKADIAGRTFRGGALTMASQVVKHVLRLGSVIVMARLLTPADYGLVAMVTAVTYFIVMFKDLGLSFATIQRREITHQQVSALFWINVLLSLAMVGVAAALAPLLAWFYGKPVLTWITLALAAGFVFGGLTVQHTALLRRQMQFGRLAAVEVAALALGVASGVTAALLGARYWALVVTSLTISVTHAVGSWLACPWRPNRPARAGGVRSLVAFGGHLTGFDVLNYFSRNIDKVLLGRFFGAIALGVYTKGMTLLAMPLRALNAPMRGVAIPALSRLADEPETYRRFYLRAIWLIAFVTMPGIALGVVLAEPLVRLLLGEQWLAAAPIFAVLGIFGLLLPIWNTNGWLYISTNQSRRMLHWGLIDSAFLLVSIAVGLPFGAMGLAWAFAVTRAGLFVPCMIHASRNTPVPWRGILTAIGPPLLASVGAAGLLLLGLRFLWAAPSAPQWVVLLAGYPIAYLALVCAVAGSVEPLRRFTRVLSMLKGALAGRRSAATQPATAPADEDRRPEPELATTGSRIEP